MSEHDSQIKYDLPTRWESFPVTSSICLSQPPNCRHPNPAQPPKVSKMSRANTVAGRTLNTEFSEMAQTSGAGERKESGSASNVGVFLQC